MECKTLSTVLCSELETLMAVKMAMLQLDLALGRFFSFSVAERLGSLYRHWKVRAPGGRSGPHGGGIASEHSITGWLVMWYKCHVCQRFSLHTALGLFGA